MQKNRSNAALRRYRRPASADFCGRFNQPRFSRVVFPLPRLHGRNHDHVGVQAHIAAVRVFRQAVPHFAGVKDAGGHIRAIRYAVLCPNVRFLGRRHLIQRGKGKADIRVDFPE